MLDIYRKENEKHAAADALSAQYLDAAKDQSPVVANALETYGDTSLFDFLKGIAPVPTTPLQPTADLEKVVYQYAEPLLGETVARQAAAELADCPVVLTANHHGVDYFAQSAQGSLLFSLFKKMVSRTGSTVPIFACGNIPLDNLTYPLGLLLYHIKSDSLDAMPKKLPVFSNKYRRAMVSVSAPFDAGMVQRAHARSEKMIQDQELDTRLNRTLHEIFQKEYGLSEVLNLSSYSDQAVVLNSRIWKRLFKDPAEASDMVYLELEKIVQRLLEIDLKNTDSLASQVLFNETLRENVICGLDKAKACWEIEKLDKRRAVDQFNAVEQKELNGCGTLFFWGINDAGRRVPLSLNADGTSSHKLCGVDDRGKAFELPFTSRDILEALNTRRLLPSLFTSFLVLTFARGVTCAGGYYQGEYLPEMQQALVKILRNTPGFQDAADRVDAVATYTYLSGMQTVMTQIDEGGLIPAGPVEIIAGGGLDEADIEKILQLTVEEAHIASLFETIPDIAPWTAGDSGWKKELALEIGMQLTHELVVK